MKKICSMILTASLLNSAVAFANTEKLFSGEAENGSASVTVSTEAPSFDKKIEILKKYKIFEGDENGNLNLDKTITRAEFTATACRMLGIAPDLLNSSNFSDVSEDFWGAGYITAAYNNGIIDGYEDLTFRPVNSITYKEVIKIIISCLGYSPLADSMGGYPSGYIATASRIGLTDGVMSDTDEFATRENVALLIFNALDIPIMQAVSYENATEFKIADGINGNPLITPRTLLEQNNTN